jgi:hypothetical protein
MNFGCLGVSAVIDLRFFNDQNKKRKNSLMCCGGQEHFPNGDNSELHVSSVKWWLSRPLKTPPKCIAVHILRHVPNRLYV